ncbi:hypothetical protein G6F57_006709 [Rhizopus arrhizus]|uniref:Uncharacterized protein n=1 Tax=Rhizopus oryzae TaxID=64495 RepID=A0A9P6XFI0_RHIOR|nr:hypothetical protein G6F23_009242 [Rhizopus arrhizus]KAG1423506.1 hypothetical protein G6F58_002787 [Rhizopus delemar]KAG0763815.1 hypothetical protein G6F24_005726 [Rhizopus arrhizus]KAG0785136.1 hypothetical protein G6F22_008064 [Rhizopus arrhizus]KAG0794236.1 hypothetical protein G6F21_003009 [Rhizopus arrhizus]
MSSLNVDQVQQVTDILSIKSSLDINHDDKVDDYLKKIENKNIGTAYNIVNSKLVTCRRDDYATLNIMKHILGLHHSNSTVFLPETLTKFSEASMVIKFWAPLFEALFSEISLILN